MENMEINIDGLMREAAQNIGIINNRCLLLAGENEALRRKIQALESQVKALSEKGKE